LRKLNEALCRAFLQVGEGTTPLIFFWEKLYGMFAKAEEINFTKIQYWGKLHDLIKIKSRHIMALTIEGKSTLR
jgi:hypothetical protein